MSDINLELMLDKVSEATLKSIATHNKEWTTSSSKVHIAVFNEHFSIPGVTITSDTLALNLLLSLCRLKGDVAIFPFNGIDLHITSRNQETWPFVRDALIRLDKQSVIKPAEE